MTRREPAHPLRLPLPLGVPGRGTPEEIPPGIQGWIPGTRGSMQPWRRIGEPTGLGIEKRCTARSPHVSRFSRSGSRSRAERSSTEEQRSPGRTPRRANASGLAPRAVRGSGRLRPVRAPGRPPENIPPRRAAAPNFIGATAGRPARCALDGLARNALQDNPCGEVGRRCCSGARLSCSRCWLSRRRLISTMRPRHGTIRACCATYRVRRPSLPTSTSTSIRRSASVRFRMRTGMPATPRARDTVPGRRPPDDSATSIEP